MTWQTRPLTLETLEEVANVYYEEWGYETEGPRELARLVARWYCSHIIGQTTFAHLLYQGEELAGITLGAIQGEPLLLAPLPLAWDEQALHQRIDTFAEGPSTRRIYETMFALNSTLRQKVLAQGISFTAELLFLWVAPKHRGEGLSKVLLDKAMDTFRSQGQQAFCLFTDSHCDVSFYQRSPWLSLAQTPWPPDIVQMPNVEELMFARHL